ncbi:hypothetical protein FHG64_00405 [Antarcticibacterium flavum]|uniref:Uncharacterized protein n=1 Tax=Antarcticibacterium flavum TaxID=2058175 RepID=A0A5B7WZX5_9FLAO|nr:MULTISPECIES: hypothetical protein [Antarcticibacterium]MCM4160808.1 hypothetical protein [Antarcticibacterium sp. W02-3]QCY67978.1 hypothetical protein FHG64_00405 [Antarcticibacterium flavum]
MRVSVLLSIFLMTGSTIFSGCSSMRAGEEDVRTAVDVPERFSTPPGLAWGANTCINPIIDPADGTELILIQSMDGLGDYRVTGGKYGVNTGELLRLNCRTGEVVGIVRGR